MKRNLLTLSMAVLTAVLFFVAGCSKDDTEKPVIILSGSNPYELVMGTSYVEPGYTAEDNEDGVMTTSVSITNNINADVPGSYTVEYSVTDAAGNTGTATRDVNVIATTTATAGSYSVRDTCFNGGIPALPPYLYNQTVTAINSTTIGFNRFGDYDNNPSITATIASNGTLTIPLQTASAIGSLAEDHRFSGSGYVTKHLVYITYTDENLTASATAICHAYYTR